MSLFAETMRSLLRNGTAVRGRIERLCAELGWPVDERDSDKITLYFKDSVVGKRNLYIRESDGRLVVFGAFSFAILRASQVPKELPGYLLDRNSELAIGKWEITSNDEGEIFFSVQYCALGDGLTAAALKIIAESLIGEANDFDSKMQSAGLLQI